tara:strand:+ start:524 stop:823 length:300 start_codon:yes stop_codon:yes gene_type:complete
VLRPIVTEDNEWDGNFEVFITGAGPVTITEENTRDLISMAMLVATTISMMEEDVDLTEKIMTECTKLYGDADDVDIQTMIATEEGLSLTVNSKTVGGVH